MYLVTNVSTLSIVNEYPATHQGFNDAVTFAAIAVQVIELYPAGILVERRLPDNSIKQIIKMTNGLN